MSLTPKSSSTTNFLVFQTRNTAPASFTPTSAKKFFFPELIDPQKIKENQVQPLSKEFFINLIRLETEFENQNLNASKIDELVQLYARAVEYYDLIRDNVSSYFIYKIQDTLSNKRSLRLLLNQNKNAGKEVNLTEESLESLSKYLDKKNSIMEHLSDGSDEEKSLEKPKFKKKKTNEARMTYSQIRQDKSKKVNQYVNIQNKVEAEIKQDKQKLEAIVSTYCNQSTKNDSIVDFEIQNQRHQLRRRLREKRLLKNREQELDSFLNGTIECLGVNPKFESSSKSKETEFSCDMEMESPQNGLILNSNLKSGNTSNKLLNNVTGPSTGRVANNTFCNTLNDKSYPEINEFDILDENSNKNIVNLL